MKDASPKQALVYDLDIRLTSNDTSNPKKYGWIEVYRDKTGKWNNLTLSGNISYDPAYEYNNGNVTIGMVRPAHRDPRTGQVLFF